MKDEKIAIIGTGMMGMSLAVLFTGNGYDTTVLATKEASVLRGAEQLQRDVQFYAALYLCGPVRASGCGRVGYGSEYRKLPVPVPV